MTTICDQYFYTIEEAAKELNVSPQTIRAYLKSGRLECTKIGRYRVISHFQMMRFLLGSDAK